ncbi:MAG: transporter permease [Gemmatimonadetes bacterium]|nr:transporter permease [Gemmatimonadota bacterium]
MRTVLFLIRKELLQIFRDRAMVLQMLLMPAIQLLVLSQAATFEVRDTRVSVVDESRTSTSRGLVAHMRASGRFNVVRTSVSMALADEDVLDRRAGMIVRFPRAFEKELVRTGAAPVQVVLNAEDGAAAGVAQAYFARVLSAYQAELGVRLRPSVRSVGASPDQPVPARGGGRIEVRTRGWFNPDLSYPFYMVPGLLVVLVTMLGTLLTAMNITREKELGTLEQLNVTPITRGQFIAGKLVPFWLLGLLELGIGLTIGRLFFGLPMRGSLLLVFAVAAVYLVAALSIGLFISTLVETQQQAVFISFFVLMIYLFMSGLFTSVASMPVWAQWLAAFNPVKHFILIMRAVLLKGAGFMEIRTPFLVLVAYAGAVFLLAVRQYRKTTA